MEVTVETPAPCLAKISFQVPPEEFQNRIQHELRHMRKHTRMKGFRPGKAPMQVVEKAYGERVRDDAKQHFLRLAFQRAVEENEIQPLGNPRVTVDELAAAELGEGGEFAYEFEADLKPAIQLGDYRGLAIESELAPVLPEEVEAAIEQFRQRQSRPEAAGDKGLVENGMAIASVRLLHEDDVVLEREGMRIGLEVPLPGVGEEVWREKLAGAAEGAVIELPIVLPQEAEKEGARGADGTARIELTQVFELVPLTDEQLFELLEVDGIEALRAKVREQLQESNRLQEEARIEGELFKRVIEMHDFELPERMVEDQISGRQQEVRSGLEAQGLSPEEIEQQVVSGAAETRTAAEQSVCAFFLIDAIAGAEKLQASEEDLLAEFRSIAARNDAKVEDVVAFYRENQQINQLALEIVERKVRRFLRESAEIKEPS